MSIPYMFICLAGGVFVALAMLMIISQPANEMDEKLSQIDDELDKEEN